MKNKHFFLAGKASQNNHTGIFRIVVLLLPVFLLPSCLKKEHFPDTPAIEFVSFTKIQNDTGIDDKGILKLSFTDGDGDIGLAQSDTLPPFNIGSQWYYNFFITYYERQKGVLTNVNLPFTNNSRIPPLYNSGSAKSTKGEIEIELFINNPTSAFDTIAFEVSIADRALHVSNRVLTPDIVIKKH
ncbi:MAG: hypothetical protein NTU44_07190 [Bacteroidetes bacterium]|nr:hypothetical protein [Bacteroidota bacterium]